MDHRVLIPLKNPKIDFKDIERNVEFFIGNKHYILPQEDCLLLDLNSTSAEDMAEYFAEELYHSLKEINSEISSVQICVNEGIGQGAYFTKDSI